MSIITLFEALLWIAAVAALILGFWFPRSRLGRGRWLAAGIAVLEPGQLLSTFADRHEWSYRRQIAVNDFELISDLVYVFCTSIFLIQSARASIKSREVRANRWPAGAPSGTRERRGRHYLVR